MKKFTSLMLMLLFAVTTWGQVSLPQITEDTNNPIYYTIYNTRSGSTSDRSFGQGGLIYFAGDAVGLKDAVDEITSLGDAYKFYFTGSYDELYVHNAATSNKLASVSSWTAEGTAWCVIQRTDGNLAFGPKDAEKGANSWWNEKNYTTNESTSDFTVWNAEDAGSGFVVEPVEDCKFPTSDAFYTIECPLFENVQGVKKGLYVDTDGSIKWNTVDLTNKNFYWVTTVNEGTVVIKNLGTNTYLSNGTMSETEVASVITPLGSNQFSIKANDYVIHANGHSNGSATNGTLANWANSANTASAWCFVERQDPDAAQEVTVTYSFVFNGNEKYTQETATLVGEEYPAITLSFPWGVSAVKPAGTIAAEDVAEGSVKKTIELSVSLPFEFESTYEDITSWYFLKFHANQNNYLYYDGTANVLDATKTSFDASNLNAYRWAFVGDPFDGFKVVNAEAGEDKALNATADGATIDTDNSHLFKVTGSSYGTNGFFMQSINGASTDRFNKQNGKVVYWSGADAGSTFMTISEDVELGAIVDAFKANATAGLGYVGGYSTEKAEAIAAISNHSEMVKFQEENSIINFEEGKYYRIQNVYRTTYISVADGNRVLREQSNADINQLWQVKAATDGAYFIKSPNAGYMQAVGTNALAAEGAELNITSFAEGAGQFNITTKGTGDMLAGIDATTLGTWWSGTIGSDMAYRFIDANDFEVTVNEFASICLPFAAKAEGEVKAYAVENIDNVNAYVSLVEKADIAANQGAILAGNGTFKFNIVDAAEANWTNNKLVGTTTNSYIAPEGGAAYVLANGENGIGLYKAALNRDETGAEGTTHFMNNANKAYLPVVAEAGANAAASYSFNFDWAGTTGIDGVVAEGAENGTIYDITGRRVKAITAPGIYIVNGKKVVK